MHAYAVLFQVTFSPDGNFLYTGARQDGQLLCWDVRCTQDALYALQRDTASTNQRIGFDIEPCGRHLATGGCDGRVLVSVFVERMGFYKWQGRDIMQYNS